MQRVERRVVVTGIGLVTPLGIGNAATWEAAIAGKRTEARGRRAVSVVPLPRDLSAAGN